MQIDNDNDIFVTLPLPYRELTDLTRPVRWEDGALCPEKRILYTLKSTDYRGEVLLCLKTEFGAEAKALADLVEVKKASDMTERDWNKSTAKKHYKRGYGFVLENVREVVELLLPSYQLLDVVMTEAGAIMPYPRVMEIGKEGWALIRKKLQDKNK